MSNNWKHLLDDWIARISSLLAIVTALSALFGIPTLPEGWRIPVASIVALILVTAGNSVLANIDNTQKKNSRGF